MLRKIEERLREKEVTEKELVRQRHQFNGHEFKETAEDKTEDLGMLQSIGWQRVGHDLATEQQHANKFQHLDEVEDCLFLYLKSKIIILNICIHIRKLFKTNIKKDNPLLLNITFKNNSCCGPQTTREILVRFIPAWQ